MKRMSAFRVDISFMKKIRFGKTVKKMALHGYINAPFLSKSIIVFLTVFVFNLLVPLGDAGANMLPAPTRPWLNAGVSEQLSVDYSAKKEAGQKKIFEELPVLFQKIIGRKKPQDDRYLSDNVSYDDKLLAQISDVSGDEEWACLRETVYFEARGESIAGQIAVAEVILNRVENPKFPASVCEVVYQRNSRGCQFSFYCDGLPENMINSKAKDRAGRIARLMLDGAPRQLTNGATYFHTHYVKPRWAKVYEKTAFIGAHIFYKIP